MGNFRSNTASKRLFYLFGLGVLLVVASVSAGCRSESVEAVEQTLTAAARTLDTQSSEGAIDTQTTRGLVNAQSSKPTAARRSTAATESLPAGVEASTLESGTITNVRISRLGDGEQCQNAPVTFGQPFVKGDVAKAQSLHAEYQGQALPTQVNVRARNDAGSARHAVITIEAPCDIDGDSVALVAGNGKKTKQAKPDISLADVLATDFNTAITIKNKGEKWRLNARALLEKIDRAGGCRDSGVFCRRRLEGPLLSGWVVGAALKNRQGNTHPRLAAYFAIRAYGPAPVSRIRVDVAVENDWAYQARPQNIEYKPTIRVGAKPVYKSKRFTHYRQARWHHVVWWGESDHAPFYAALNPRYLQSTGAVPEYQGVDLSRKMMAKARQHCPPMRHCGQTKRMEAAGAQASIGPLPRWSAAFVIDPNYRMYRWMLANTDALGAYGIHYRQRDTGLPLSVRDHPCATIIGPGDTEQCPVAPHADDRFPDCHGNCDSPLKANTAHHPAPAYTAYLATGDWYYQTEMTFWADWVVFFQNPEYRGYTKGLVHDTQLRAQAWMLRSLGDAAYLLPDDAPKKHYFNQAVGHNIEWYNKHYTNNPKANKLGANTAYQAVRYPVQGHGWTGIAPWQQSFFTWAVGNLVDQRFPGAKAFLDWTSQFQVGQMTSPGYCWELASAYKVRIRETREGPFYDSFAQVFAKTYPGLAHLGCEAAKLNAAIRHLEIRKKFDYPPGTMIGYPSSATGFVANYQIGLAAAARSSLPNAVAAWNKFVHQPILPDYTSAPQFAVVPRKPPQP